MLRHPRQLRGGFSLIELVMVMVIIGAIAAIAIPRLTRGANRSGAIALKTDLAVFRKAIELYRAEHEGRSPNGDGPELGEEKITPDWDIVEQLTMVTKIDSTDPAAKPNIATGRVYGPYMSAIPPLPVGSKKGATEVSDEFPGDPEEGWFYASDTATIYAALTATETDAGGVPYKDY